MLRVTSIHQNVHGSNPKPKEKQHSIEATLPTPGMTGMTSTEAGTEVEMLRAEITMGDLCCSTQNTQVSEPKVTFADTPRCFLCYSKIIQKSLTLPLDLSCSKVE